MKVLIRITVSFIIFLAIISHSGCDRKRNTTAEKQGTLHYQLAIDAYNDGKYERAIQHFEKALLFDPKEAEIYLNLGAIYDDYVQNKEKAVFYYNKFIELSKDPEKTEKVMQWIQSAQEDLSKDKT